ncbi:hypothetical protein AALP_AA3G052200 [Arabis alpina]|uniref:Glabrous enhancer-binding protein-like C-terminal domain-containing protein n=1 Tax=Arabis alpina TaxID=50452 RepID=A0A087H759_ARAAL|nr:hypothetical protein AALP_AA3G052200 [Arabis alpina]
MAKKENQHARDDNEVEDEEEKQIIDSCSSDDDSSDSESESECMESANRDEELLEDAFVAEQAAYLGMSEESVKEMWRMMPMETKQKLAGKWTVLKAKEVEIALEKAALIRRIIILLFGSIDP